MTSESNTTARVGDQSTPKTLMKLCAEISRLRWYLHEMACLNLSGSGMSAKQINVYFNDLARRGVTNG